MSVLDPRAPTLSLLDRLGPDVEPDARPRISEREAEAYCRELALGHYENFSVLTGLVPPALRPDFAAVYAFCRWSDDLGDETGSDEAARERSTRLLAWWRGELNSCRVWTERPTEHAPPTHPVFIALASTFRRHAHLTVQPFDDLIRAFEQDQRVTRYQTWDELVDYCSRSANPVGRIVLTLAGYAPPTFEPNNAERYRLSDLTCTALQLINFWQDVRRDLIERDRVYLPSAETGITETDLRDWLDPPGSLDPVNRIRYIRAVRSLVSKTDAMFAEADRLPELLNPAIAPVVRLFADGGRAVLRAVEHSGCTTLWHRPKLSAFTKGTLLARAWFGSRRRSASAISPPPLNAADRPGV